MLIELAREKDRAAIFEIFNRLDGKPIQAMVIDHGAGGLADILGDVFSTRAQEVTEGEVDAKEEAGQGA